MKIFKLLLIMLTAIILTSCSALMPEEPAPAPTSEPAVIQNQTLSMLDYFPLRQGAYWIYEGQIRWTNPAEAEIVEETIQWKMEVVRVIQRGGVVGFEMLGAPTDLAWYDENKQRSSYAYIYAGGKIYRTPVDVLERMDNPEDFLLEMVNENQVFINIPLMDGQKICNSAMITRVDGRYCYQVHTNESFDPSTFSKLKLDASAKEFSIQISTNPDHGGYGFIPGIGISRYYYVHHGTVSEADVKLIEYFPGEINQ